MCSDAIRICVPAVAAFMLMPVAGCSIKEDRESCPCYLTIRAGSEAAAHDGVFWFVDAEGFKESGVLIVADGNPQCMFGVPRGDVNLYAVSGAGACISSDGSVSIPSGEQCPPVFCYHAWLNTRCDSLTDTIRLHKNFALVRLHGYDAGALCYELTGEICGYDSRGNPVPGPFRAVCLPKEDSCSCRVPRQMDDSLMLCLYRDGLLVRTFPIGEYMEESGYDWSAEDLEDIDISLDFTATEVVITVNGWVKTLTFYIDF